MSAETGCVYLVGAGCGQMDLVTLRGLRRLQTCDVVVYDDLIDGELLEAAPAHAERIYMGKRRGRHSASQAEICGVLVERALAGKRVVRLKGGDPFVFGRGGEEIQALQAAGIPYEEVPGISSAIAIPAAAGIPVTHRGVSRSFHVVTGHTADGPDGLPEDLAALAALHGTLVFLMGLAQLRWIADGLMAAGKPPQTPAAVLSGGSAPRPAAVRGTLADIADRAAGMAPPAVIVVGETAALEFSTPAGGALAGVRVGVTGTAAVADKLRAGLEAQGAAVETVERSIVDPLPLEEGLAGLFDGGAHWLVFTSGNGVEVFFRQIEAEGLDLRRLNRCKIAVIGAATGARLRRRGICPDLCPERFTGAALGQALCRQVAPGEDVVLLRSREGDPALPRTLAAAGIPVRDVPLYTLHPDRRTAERGPAALPGLDYLAFSSASGVELFFRACPAIPAGVTCVCIGEVTARAFAERDKRPCLTAGEISAAGIVAAILDHRAGRPVRPDSRRE